MQVVFDIPDEMAQQFAASGESLSRAALEAFALEGYRTERLSESEICRLLGFETRIQVHGFLKEHHCYLNYSLDDLKNDIETAKFLEARQQTSVTK